MCRKPLPPNIDGHTKVCRTARSRGSSGPDSEAVARRAEMPATMLMVCAMPWLPVSPSFCVRKEVKNEKRRKEKNITSKPRGEMENCKTSLGGSERTFGGDSGNGSALLDGGFDSNSITGTSSPRPASRRAAGWAGRLIFFRSSKEATEATWQQFPKLGRDTREDTKPRTYYVASRNLCSTLASSGTSIRIGFVKGEKFSAPISLPPTAKKQNKHIFIQSDQHSRSLL